MYCIWCEKFHIKIILSYFCKKEKVYDCLYTDIQFHLTEQTSAFCDKPYLEPVKPTVRNIVVSLHGVPEKS